MKSVIITGCNRGIGFSLVKQMLNLSTPPEYIIATCRNLTKADALKEISQKKKNVHILEIDLNHFDKYEEFAENVKSIVGENGVNLIINNAGISTKFTRIGLLKLEQMMESLTVNAVAPIMLSKTCLPFLKQASTNNSHLPMGTTRAAIINISSILGSIEKNTDGGFYPYRCSKAALNMATKSLSADLKNDKILVVSIHPGWLKTDLGGKNAPLEVDDTVKKMLDTITILNDKHNGAFIQYDGTSLPW